MRGLSLTDAVKKMRGKPGTKVTLTIARKTETKPLVFTLARAVIKTKSVKYKLLEPDYGYVRITQFQEHTSEDLAAGIQALYKENKQGLKGLVLDLRDDPGGLLNGAVGVSAAFLAKNQLVVYTEGRTPDAKMRLTANLQNYARPNGSDPLSSCRRMPATCRWWCWSTAVRPRRRKSSPARCRTTSARCWWAPRPSARLGTIHHAAGQRRRHR